MFSASASHRPPAYRPDIDGLRAIAVLLVVIYHAFPTTLPGGFIGVDVFFVISGYLITSILLDAHQRGEWSLAVFYARRARRLLPALSIVILATFVAGWFVLLPDQFRQLGLHMLASAGFFQNIVLMREAGYFDQSSELKPLNHIWSLGVEEQFYLIFPLILWLGLRYKNGPWILLITLFSTSLVYNVVRISSAPVETFFLLPSRFWELLAGSLLCLWQSRRAQNNSTENKTIIQIGVTLSGLLLIVWGAIFLTSTQPYPGFWAVIPVLGAVLVIGAGASNPANRILLSHSAVIAIGLISYPLYLWHWPLLALPKAVLGETLSMGLRLILIALSVGLALLTYRFIENPIRFGANRTRMTKSAIVMATIAAILGGITFFRDGFSFRFQDRAEFVAHFENTAPELRYMMTNGIWEKNRIDCNYFDAHAWRAGNPNPPARESISEDCTKPKTGRSILIWGDSHAAHLYHGLREALPPSISLLIVATSGCAPHLPGQMQPPTETCERSTITALETARREKPELVILAQWKGHGVINPLDEITRRLKEVGVRRVLLVGPVPQWEPYLYRAMASQHWLLKPRRLNANRKNEPLETDNLLAKSPAVKSGLMEYVSLVHFLCDSSGCLTHFGNNLRDSLITYDYGHFTPEASKMIAQELLTPIILGDISNQAP